MTQQKNRPPRTLQEALREHGSQARLARKLRISVTHLSQIRKGKKQPSLDLALDIEKETGVPVETMRLPRRAA